MWQFMTLTRDRNLTGNRAISSRRSRLYRPRCKPLEDRCLLSVSLSGTEPAGRLVGSPVVWTATSSGHGSTPVYQFSVARSGGPGQVVRDFSTANNFRWNPMREGSYVVQVTVKDGFNVPTGETATISYTANSRTAGSAAVVSHTANPLVALYSAPPSAGSSMSVQFEPLGANEAWTSTASLPIAPGESTNFLVAGMLPHTTYVMRHVLDNGTTSTPLTFTTGSPPSNLTFPSFTVQRRPGARSDLTQNLVFHVGINPPDGTVDTLATDRMGNVAWYYDPVANAFPSYATRLTPGGTVLLLGGKLDEYGGASVLREVDLAGNTLRETNLNAVNAQLAAVGQHAVADFNHEALRLPNGDTAVLAKAPRIVSLNGAPTRYNGDMVIVLDQNFQVAWVWDPFAWLNTNRLPTLGEGPGDWMHSNSIGWSPADGNLIVSMRSQDWVVKIDYANGTGDGHVIWRLGPGGDFTLRSNVAAPWFSHQHDVTYINNNTLLVFDNGNVRNRRNRRAESRGQILVLDERTMRARLAASVDIGNYAFAVGSAQMLPNGNLVLNSGIVEQTIEMRRNGAPTYVLKMNMPGLQYRSYIYPNLYGVPASTASTPSTANSRRFAMRQQRLQRLAELRLQRNARQGAVALPRAALAATFLNGHPRG